MTETMLLPLESPECLILCKNSYIVISETYDSE